MANRTIQITVGAITNWANNSQSYYGLALGVNLVYGVSRNNYFNGKDGRTYRLHICRWATTNSILVRIDNPLILSSEPYTSYTTPVFDSITINGTTFNPSATSSGSTVNGSALLFWDSVSTNPFGTTTGVIQDITFSGVSDGPYGAEFSNSSGKLMLSMIDRVERFVVADTTPPIPPYGGSIFVSVSGMENNDSWNVYAGVNGPPESITRNPFDITKSTGGFTITNLQTGSYLPDTAYDYWVLRT